MSKTVQDITTLKINYLTQAQYDAEVSGGTVEENEIYLTPDDASGLVTDVQVDGTSVVTSGVASVDLTGKANASHTHTTSEVTDFPTLSTVATTGDYDDLLDKPTIPALGMTIPYGVCSTGASTVAKTVSITGVTALTTGMTIAVKFDNSNSATDPTLKVNTLDAKAMKKYGTTAPGTSAKMSWYAGSVLILVYDGSYWQIVNWDNVDTTYSALTQSDMQTGTATTGRLISAARLKEAIGYHGPSDFTGTDGTSAGTKGLVPAPATTDANKYLKSDGTWATVSGGGGGSDVFWVTYGTTTTAEIEAAYQANKIVLMNYAYNGGEPCIYRLMVRASSSTHQFYAIKSPSLYIVTVLSDYWMVSTFNIVYSTAQFPKGSYYETSDSTFNPATQWGGTWNLDSSANSVYRWHRTA